MSNKLYQFEPAMVTKASGSHRVGDLISYENIKWHAFGTYMSLSEYQQLRMLKARKEGNTEEIAQGILNETKMVHEIPVGHLSKSDLDKVRANQKKYIQEYLMSLTDDSELSRVRISRVLAYYKVEFELKKMTWDEFKYQELCITNEEAERYEAKQQMGRDMRDPRKYNVKIDYVVIRLTDIYRDQVESMLWNIADWFEEPISNVLYEVRYDMVRELRTKVKDLKKELDIE